MLFLSHAHKCNYCLHVDYLEVPNIFFFLSKMKLFFTVVVRKLFLHSLEVNGDVVVSYSET